MKDIDILREQALKVRDAYKAMNHNMGNKQWTVTDYTSGMVGDVGDFTKLIMAKEGLRKKSDIDEKLAHELCDILWCVFVLADELNIDLDQVFEHNMETLLERITKNEG